MRIGAAFVSRWTPQAIQGTALGIFGLGLLGQSAAVFGGALAATAFGWQVVFRGVGALLFAWAIVFVIFARNNPSAARPAGWTAMMRVLREEPVAWWLGVFYFLTFGGFVAFSIYLPTLLRSQFGLTAGDAGFRAAGFVVLATLMRPLGGWLADRIGGAQVLSWVFSGVDGFALLLAWPSMIPFTVGALGCAALLGLAEDTKQQRRKEPAEGIFLFVLIMVVLQLWLLTATMNAYLGGDDGVVWPAAIASLLCFALNAGLLRYMWRLENPRS